MQAQSKIAHLHLPERSAVASLESQVRTHLEQLLSSSLFDASARSRDFLCFVVDETLAGRGATINQTAIAIGVFGRRPDFDPVLDPIVRVQAGRLRRSLERYYLLRNADPIRIELPKGGYMPAFIPNNSQTARQLAAEMVDAPEWPLLIVRDLEVSCVAERTLALRAADELTMELHRYGDLRVARGRALYWDDDGDERRGRGTARFELRGTLRCHEDDVWIVAEVIDRSSGEDLWRETFHCTNAAGGSSRSIEDIARVIAACIGSDHGVIVRSLVSEHHKRLFTADVSYSAILRSYHRSFLGQRSDVISTLEAVLQLTEREPERALTWTHLAQLYLQNYSYELSDVRTPIEKSISAAYRALHVDPNCGLARCIVAAALLVKGDTHAAIAELQKLRQLLGDSLAHRELAGSLLVLCGETANGLDLLRDAIARNPFCSPLMNQALWAHHMQSREFELAYRAALAYQDSSGFWRELMLACALMHLDRHEDARANLIELLRTRPDFPHRRRELVGHYIKSSPLRDAIEDSLIKLGMKPLN